MKESAHLLESPMWGTEAGPALGLDAKILV